MFTGDRTDIVLIFLVSLSKRTIAVFSSRSLESDTQICGDLQKRGQSENLNRHAGKKPEGLSVIGNENSAALLKDKKRVLCFSYSVPAPDQRDSVLSKAA